MCSYVCVVHIIYDFHLERSFFNERRQNRSPLTDQSILLTFYEVLQRLQYSPDTHLMRLTLSKSQYYRVVVKPLELKFNLR